MECESLKSINIPNGFISIETGAFADINVYDLIVIFRNKDFYVKMNRYIKYRAIAEYSIHTSDLDAETYIKKNSLKSIKFVIENFSANDFCFFLHKNIFVTKRNIDKFIIRAVESGTQ